LIDKVDLEHAVAELRGVVTHTPVHLDTDTSRVAGQPVWLKLENLQQTGSFKYRGASLFIRALPKDVQVVAPSAGNHAQAVAAAATQWGHHATVVLPESVSATKRVACERYGAKVVLAGTTSDDRQRAAAQIAAELGAVIVPPFDHPTIIAGQATVGCEILEDVPDVATIVVPVGGGGLAAGVCAAVRLTRPEVRVVGVELVTNPKLGRALAAGRPVQTDEVSALASALVATSVGVVPFPYLRQWLDEVVVVDDSGVREAMDHLVNRCKVVAEPSGAAALAAVRMGLIKLHGPVCVIISGGNVSHTELAEMLRVVGDERHPAAAG
jgi:threonine dehydratase